MLDRELSDKAGFGQFLDCLVQDGLSSKHPRALVNRRHPEPWTARVRRSPHMNDGGIVHHLSVNDVARLCSLDFHADCARVNRFKGHWVAGAEVAPNEQVAVSEVESRRSQPPTHLVPTQERTTVAPKQVDDGRILDDGSIPSRDGQV